MGEVAGCALITPSKLRFETKVIFYGYSIFIQKIGHSVNIYSKNRLESTIHSINIPLYEAIRNYCVFQMKFVHDYFSKYYYVKPKEGETLWYSKPPGNGNRANPNQRAAKKRKERNDNDRKTRQDSGSPCCYPTYRGFHPGEYS
jgi:hypothetical protein